MSPEPGRNYSLGALATLLVISLLNPSQLLQTRPVCRSNCLRMYLIRPSLSLSLSRLSFSKTQSCRDATPKSAKWPQQPHQPMLASDWPNRPLTGTSATSQQSPKIASRASSNINAQSGWRPSLVGWRPSQVGWRPSLVGWTPLLVGWRPSLVGGRPLLLGWRPSLYSRLEAIPSRLEAIASRREASAIRLEAIASRRETLGIIYMYSFYQCTTSQEASAQALETIPNCRMRSSLPPHRASTKSIQKVAEWASISG